MRNYFFKGKIFLVARAAIYAHVSTPGEREEDLILVHMVCYIVVIQTSAVALGKAVEGTTASYTTATEAKHMQNQN